MAGVTATLIGMGVAKAVTGIASAKAQSNASKKAASIQSASADRAIDMHRQIWGQQQQNMAPYMAAGTNSMNLLGSLMQVPGTPGAYRPGIPPGMPPPGMPPGQGGPPPGWQPPQQPPPGMSQLHQPIMGRPMRQPGNLGSMMMAR